MRLWTKIREFAGQVGRTSSNQPTQTPEEIFSAEVEKLAHALPSVTSVERKPEDFSLVVVGNGRNYTVFLGNIFAETRDLMPDERVHRVRRFLAAIEETFEDDCGDW